MIQLEFFVHEKKGLLSTKEKMFILTSKEKMFSYRIPKIWKVFGSWYIETFTKNYALTLA